MRWFLRMSRRARNPPSPKMAMMVAAIVVAAFSVAGLERMGLWPDWATAEKMPKRVNVN